MRSVALATSSADWAASSSAGASALLTVAAALVTLVTRSYPRHHRLRTSLPLGRVQHHLDNEFAKVLRLSHGVPSMGPPGILIRTWTATVRPYARIPATTHQPCHCFTRRNNHPSIVAPFVTVPFSIHHNRRLPVDWPSSRSWSRSNSSVSADPGSTMGPEPARRQPFEVLPHLDFNPDALNAASVFRCGVIEGQVNLRTRVHGEVKHSRDVSPDDLAQVLLVVVEDVLPSQPETLHCAGGALFLAWS